MGLFRSWGDIILDEYEHPVDNVVYALGSDFTGFDNHNMDGITIKLRDVIEAGKGEKKNNEIRKTIDDTTMHNIDGVTYFFYPVEALEGFDGALKFF